MTGSGAPASAGCDIRGAMPAGFESILTREALDFLATLARRFTPRVHELLARAKSASARWTPATLPDFLPETRAIRESDWRVADLPAGSARPARRDHRAHRPQDDHQRAQFGREGVHGRLRGLAHAELGQSDPRPDEPARCGARHHRVHEPGRQALPAESEVAVLLVRPRGWHLFEKHLLVDGEQMPGGARRFRLYLFHNARELAKRGHRTVLLSAEARIPSRSAPLVRGADACRAACSD